MKISQGFCIALGVGIGLTFAQQLDSSTNIGAVLGGGWRVGAAIVGAASGAIGAAVHGLLMRKRALAAIFLAIGFLCVLVLVDGHFVRGLVEGFEEGMRQP